MRHDRYFCGRHVEIVGHEVGEGMIERHKAIDVTGALTQQHSDRRVMRFGDLFDKNILARQAANNLCATGAPHPICQTDEEHVGEVHDIRLRVAGEPVRELGHFLALVPLFRLEGGDGERSQIGWPHRACATGEPFEEATRVKKPIDTPRRIAKQRYVFLKPDIHATENNFFFGDIFFIGHCGHIGRHKDRIAAPRLECPHEGVVVEA